MLARGLTGTKRASSGHATSGVTTFGAFYHLWPQMTLESILVVQVRLDVGSWEPWCLQHSIYPRHVTTSLPLMASISPGEVGR